MIKKDNRLDINISKNFFITINKPKQSNKQLCEYIENLKDFKSCIFQREKSKKEQEHIHLVLSFDKDKSLEEVASIFPNAHIKAVFSDLSVFMDYCSKKVDRISGPYEITKTT